MYKLWNMLAEMKSDAYEWVELSHSMNNDSPVWSGIPTGSVEVSKTVFDWGNPMLECLIQTFKFPGQYGTHIDFPGHFVKDMPLSEAFGAQQMLFPLCVIDITAKVAEDVHYAVTVEDIKAYEAEYGAIPDGAFVALPVLVLWIYVAWFLFFAGAAVTATIPKLTSGRYMDSYRAGDDFLTALAMLKALTAKYR